MSYYSEIDDIKALEDEVGICRIDKKVKNKPISICDRCSKKRGCHMNNGVRQACNHIDNFIKSLI
jgi:sulfur relay (sulfurtransferase) complex TusBCD TusD component (DsrE family)